MTLDSFQCTWWGARPRAAYIAIFTCMATRVMHLELVIDCTTAAFLAAFNRFCSRPASMYSDKGTNFQDANREVRATFRATLWNVGSVPFAHIAIDHNHSQQPVPKDFPLFKRCEWLVVNCNVDKRAPFEISMCNHTSQQMRSNGSLFPPELHPSGDSGRLAWSII